MPLPADSLPQRMTAAEYAEALRSLHARLAADRKAGESTKVLNEQLADQEFLLSIDYRLGRDYPPDRRYSLLEAHRTMRRQRAKVSGRLVRRELTPAAHANEIQRVVDEMLRAFARVLSPAEYEALTAFRPDQPSLRLVDR